MLAARKLIILGTTGLRSPVALPLRTLSSRIKSTSMSAASDSTVLQSGGASEPARPAPEDYSDRWEAIWGAGLERGQASSSSPLQVESLPLHA